MSLDEYVGTQRANMELALKLKLFDTTIPRMDELYRLSVDAVPEDEPEDGPDLFELFWQFLLICHKSFLEAATLIGQTQDAAPITRRAIEAVRLVAAMKADPAIAEKWLAYEIRILRWEAWQEGEEPKGLHIHIPISHPLVERLMVSYGVLSDADVYHLTPEYFSDVDWESRGGKMILQYFTDDTIESDVLHLLGAHMVMLQVFDEYLECALSSSTEWQRLRYEIAVAAKSYAKQGSMLGLQA